VADFDRELRSIPRFLIESVLGQLTEHVIIEVLDFTDDSPDHSLLHVSPTFLFLIFLVFDYALLDIDAW